MVDTCHAAAALSTEDDIMLHSCIGDYQQPILNSQHITPAQEHHSLAAVAVWCAYCWLFCLQPSTRANFPCVVPAVLLRLRLPVTWLGQTPCSTYGCLAGDSHCHLQLPTTSVRAASGGSLGPPAAAAHRAAVIRHGVSYSASNQQAALLIHSQAVTQG